jgi:hypothetical protein
MARMTSSGSSSELRRELFPAGFAGEVMALILNVWTQFARNPRVRLETRITAVFRESLIGAYEAAGRGWFITLEDPITDSEFGTEEGRNDLRFYPPRHYRQTVYFALECKRLRATWNSGFKHLADRYVDEGLQKYVDGSYSPKLYCAGMLGYVMDNRLDEAMADVRSQIEARRSGLKMSLADSLRSPSSTLPDYRWSADSFHDRVDGMLCIHHLLVAISPAQSVHAAPH